MSALRRELHQHKASDDQHRRAKTPEVLRLKAEGQTVAKDAEHRLVRLQRPLQRRSRGSFSVSLVRGAESGSLLDESSLGWLVRSL